MNDLDFASLLKISQSISCEINLEGLIKKLIHVTIENAGANRVLFFINKNSTLYVKAEGTCESEIKIMDSVSLDSIDTIPKSIINYVKRTREVVLLNEGPRDKQFQKDPYFEKEEPKSIFCMPILNEEKMLGIMYLENNLTFHAFTSKRLDIFKILATQIAISLENAILFQKVIKTKEDLQNLNNSLKEEVIELKKLETENSMNKDRIIYDLIVNGKHVFELVDSIHNPLEDFKKFLHLIKTENLSSDQILYLEKAKKSVRELEKIADKIS